MDKWPENLVGILLHLVSHLNGRHSRLSKGAAWLPLLAACGVICTSDVHAGGSGLSVLIVANQASSNSVELANYYRVKRQIPPENVLRISWPGSNIEWTRAEFTNTLLNPLLAFVTQNQLSKQIQYVVLSMAIPYRITGSQNNSTTAALFYGFKGSSSNLNNSYALSEADFAISPPDTAPTNSFLTMMLTADTLDEARHMIDQGVASDGTFPSRPAWLVKSTDVTRNKRYKEFDNAIFNARLRDRCCLFRTNSYSAPAWTNTLGYQLGVANFSVALNAFVPGAIADNMTSDGGKIFENTGQTTLLEFIKGGASGSYGTVTEPLPSTVKFPNPMVYFYQSRGFNLAECYYQSVEVPYQGLLVGEPLAAPWRRTFNGYWTGMNTNAALQGATNLHLTFSASQSGSFIDRIDLFTDGRYSQTLTNISPQAGNRVSVRLNGYTMSYDVPTNATLKSIATGLAAELNKSANTNITKVRAQAIGDRIELQSFAEPLPAGVFEVVDNEATFAEPRVYLAVPGAFSRTSTVSTLGLNGDGDLRIAFSSAPGVSNVLEASTNLIDWVTVHSNPMGGPMEFLETNVAMYPQRFYRVSVPPAKPTPHLHVLGFNASNQFMVEISDPANRPYLVQASTNRIAWTDVSTNGTGGSMWFTDAAPAVHPVRYYRTRSGDSNDYAPVAVVGQTGTGGNILHIQDTSPGDVVVWASTNGTEWIPIYTYAGSPSVQMEADSASGAGEPLTTHLSAARQEFLPSTAQGLREFGVELDLMATLTDTSHLTLEVTKTNGAVVTLSVTNTPGNTDMMTFVQAFADAVNAEPQLLSQDGLEADDLIGGFPGQILFDLRARAGGRLAAEIQAHLTASADLSITHKTSTGSEVPHTSPVALNQNTGDLLARNHLYVSGGVASVAFSFDLDTSTLSDGYHELTAVAYEGNNVRSQTLKTLPVIVSNTPLEATLSLASASSTNLVEGSFDLVVSANTNSVDEIQLFTTGGLYDTRTNQQMVTFSVNGQDLGVGQHPFHALVTTTNGLSYRTRTVTVTLVR